MEDVGGGARMSQQPSMSSFSALEFHAGHHKGAAHLGAAASRLPRRRAVAVRARPVVAILVKRFITPVAARSIVSPGAFETIVDAGREGSPFLFAAENNAPSLSPRGRNANEARRGARKIWIKRFEVSLFFLFAFMPL